MTEAATFEELGLSPDLVESLSAEGYERPTAFQAAAIPVLRRDNHLVGSAGAGAGVLLSYACPLLDRIADGSSKGALILHPSALEAVGNARSLSNVAAGVGISVAALRSFWAAPERAQILFGSPADVLAALQGAELKLDGFDCVVIVGAAEIERSDQSNALTTVLQQLPSGGPRAVFDLPVGRAAESIAERFFERAVHVPPRSVTGAIAAGGAPTGETVLYQLVGADRTSALFGRLAELSRHGRRVAVLFRTDDQVADVGDLISLYGYDVGEVGDADAAVWISSDAAESVKALQAAEESVTVISFETPSDQAAMERTAGDSHEWIVLTRSTELGHLRVAAAASGVRLRAAAPLPSRTLLDEESTLGIRLEARLGEGGLAPYARMAESLLDGRDPIEVAAAALALVAETVPVEAPELALDPSAPRASAKAPVQAWSKLFVSIGERDGVRIGDLLGAVTNEANVKGQQVGKIDVQESHSLIEVDGKVADRVIKALNGTTIRGRSLRVDYDRSHRRQDARPSEQQK